MSFRIAATEFFSNLKPDKREKSVKPRKGVRKISKKLAAHRASPEGKAGFAHMGCVKQLHCVICAAKPPNDAHHCKSKVPFGEINPYKTDPLVGRNEYDTIPLCKKCHQDGPLAFHRGQRSWEERNGPDYAFLGATRAAVAAMLGRG